MSPEGFRQLLDRLGYSWAGYRKVRRGVQRRITRHMEQLGCREISDYLEIISQDEATLAECERRMTVPISRFFRDRRVWEVLGHDVLPRLLERTAGTVRVWSAGCAGGEEIYSFKILWESIRPRGERVPVLEALASDLNPDNLARARRGIYGAGTLREVPAAVRERWFQPLSGSPSYRIDPSVQEGITWAFHDLRERPLGTGFDILFLRNNVLTYCEVGLQRMILDRLLPTLAFQGVLVIGGRERLPNDLTGVSQLPGCRSVWMKDM
jgi:chemotaxis methyl-accepting protein methylase